MAEGKKFDEGKAPAFQGLAEYFPRALLAVADISLYGKQKYGSYGGWPNVPAAGYRYADALWRHLLAFARGEVVDPESNKLHNAHAAWNALAVLELELRHMEKSKQ